MSDAPRNARGERRPGRIVRWLPWVLLIGSIVLGLFAPLLANDVPLVARVDGRWSFPAFADLVGDPPPGPHDLGWKQWWSRLDGGSEDFAWMPPWPYGPEETSADRFRQRPDVAHPFGCDDTGRDVLSRVVHGARTAVLLGLPAVIAAALIGSLLGAWAALAGGIVDFAVQRLIELFLCFPTLLFLMFASAFFGSNATALTVVMTLLFWIAFARIVRGEILSLRERDFVMVARGLGVSSARIVVRHLLPQLIGQIGVVAAFAMASAIAAESTLSFLGLGPQAASSWGVMLRQGASLAAAGEWHLWLFPAAAIIATVVTCHVVADRIGAGSRRVTV